MCGILGYYRREGISRERLVQTLSALNRLSHRGPDGDGVRLVNTSTGESWFLQTPATPSDLSCDLRVEDYVDGQADLFIGHRRLSIFDLSSAGHQPMPDAGGNILCFNGEVYNFLELRSELKGKGYSFATGTDTEVILAAYRHWGPECLQRFNGMWSMILWDKEQRKLMLSNDRAGIKQLYRFGGNDEWMVASEIKSIRELYADRLEVDKERASFFLVHRGLDTSVRTLYKGVDRVPPATFSLRRCDEAPSFELYWDFPKGVQKYGSLGEAAEELRSLLDSSIGLRMRSDVPWGTTLSGGLDSSSIVYVASALMGGRPGGAGGPASESLGGAALAGGLAGQGLAGRRGPQAVRTFSAIFPGQSGDESYYSKMVESHLGTNATYIQPVQEFTFADFETFLGFQDQAVAGTSMYAQYTVMREVSRSSVKVLLDGQGGDELFAGYHHHVYKLGRDLLLRGRIGAYRKLVRDFCELRQKDPAEVKKLIRNDLKFYLKLKATGRLDGPPEALEWNLARSLKDVLRLDLRSWVMPSLLRYEDRNSMAFGLEARLPYLDYRIIEFAFQLPDEFKIRNGWQKAILREAVQELPKEIRYRKDKKGFSTPEDEWVAKFRDEFVAHGKTVLEAGIPDPWGIPLEKLSAPRLYRLGNLGLWMKGKV